MAFSAPIRRASVLSGLAIGLAALWTPVCAAAPPQARLVHCGTDTCLRISGHRPGATIAIRVAGQDLAVEGDRAWRVTVPLTTARNWASASGDTLTVNQVDAHGGVENRTVVLPPGALGHRLELASLMVQAH